MSASRRSDSAALGTPTDLSPANVGAITTALNPLVADAFALYLKTKNFHWLSAARISAITICCSTNKASDLCDDGRACRKDEKDWRSHSPVDRAYLQTAAYDRHDARSVPCTRSVPKI
jgi:hypothetical protein